MKSRDSVSPTRLYYQSKPKSNYSIKNSEVFRTSYKKINSRRTALPSKDAYLNLSKFKHHINSSRELPPKALVFSQNQQYCMSPHASHPNFADSIKENISAQRQK